MTFAWLLLPLALAQEGQVSMGTTEGPPDYYVIQEGDTLWDISTRFLGDPYAWPELWSINGYITNPHWIYPGNRIYFRLGDALNPPAASPQDVQPVQQPVTVGALCDFEPRFDYTQRGRRLYAPATLGSPSDLNIQGEVYGSETGSIELGDPQIVYLKVRHGRDVECGQQLAIFKEVERSVKGGHTKFGRMYRQNAVVRVFRVDGDMVTATVEQSYFEFERGDVVGDPIIVDYDVNMHAPDADQPLDASIIARMTVEQLLASVGETVFLDRGTNDGVEPGTALYLVSRREGLSPFGEDDPLLPERVVGRVIVVRAEEGWSTGVVVDAATNVDVGARLTSAPNAR